MLVNEISPKHLTGMFGSCHQLFVTLAIALCSIFGIFAKKLGEEEIEETNRHSFLWRVGYGVPFLLSGLQVLLLLIVYRYESPSFYCVNNDDEMVH